MKLTPLFTLAAIVIMSSRSLAGDQVVPAYDVSPVEVAPLQDDDFEAHLWIDGWIVQLDVGVSNSVVGLSDSLFLGFDDIMSNLDWIVPVGGDFRYKQIGFMPDLVALGISGAKSTPGPFYDQAEADLSMGILNLPVYVRVIDRPETTLDLLAGARYLWVDLDITLSGGPLGDARGPAEAGTDAGIWDGIIGARLHQEFGDKWFCGVYGDVGTGNSDLTWQLLGDIGYQLTDHLAMSVGYRYIHYDLGEENTDIDLTGSGVQVTFDWKF